MRRPGARLSDLAGKAITACTCLRLLVYLADDPDVRVRLRDRFAPLCAPVFKRLHARQTDPISVGRRIQVAWQQIKPDVKSVLEELDELGIDPLTKLDQQRPWLDFADALGVAVPSPDAPSPCSWPGCTRDLEGVKMKMCAKCRSVVRPRF